MLKIANRTLVLATKNRGKVREIKKLLKGTGFRVVCMENFPRCPEIKENGATYLQNARKKALHAAKYTRALSLADDSGIEVFALEKKPGVFSARFAGRNATDKKNNDKLISLLKNVPYNRRGCRYVCVVVLAAPSGMIFSAQGICHGKVLTRPAGNNGFGYDPLFYLPKFKRTMAQLPLSVKNTISHRGKALDKIKKHILKLSKDKVK